MGTMLSLDRRSFLKAGAGAVACAGVGAAAAGLSVEAAPQQAKAYELSEIMSEEELPWEQPDDPIADDQIARTVECDAVVVGAGLAGLPCAVRLASLGVDVHLVEKGPTFAFPRAVFTAVNSQIQKDAGEVWSQEQVDSFINTYIEGCGFLNTQYEVVRCTIEQSGPCLDFFAPIFEEAGIAVNYIGNTAFLVPDLSEPPSPDWMEPLAEYAVAHGTSIHYSEPAKQLVTNEAGDVVGVITLADDGSYVKYLARGGVILATGGIDRDYAFNRRYVPNFDKLVHDFTYKNDTGDGHKMAIWIGADYEKHGCTEPFLSSDRQTQVRILTDETDCTMCIGWPQQPAVATLPTLWVNDAGYRCMNEHDSFVGMSVANSVLNQANGKVWAVWDSAWEEKMPEDRLMSFANGGAASPYAVDGPLTTANTNYWFTENSQRQIDLDVEEGITVRCDTLEELAQAMGVEPEVLAETVAHYNEICAEGVDHEFYKVGKWLTTVDTPPFYAAHIGVSNCCTRLGLKRNGKSQVLDHNGRPIPGLYAVGNAGGGFFGPTNIPEPMSVSKAQIDGFIAANSTFETLQGIEGWQPRTEEEAAAAGSVTGAADPSADEVAAVDVEKVEAAHCSVMTCHGGDIYDFTGDDHEIEQMVGRMGADLTAAERAAIVEHYKSLQQ